MSAFVVAAEALVRDLRAAKRRPEFQVIDGCASSLEAHCTKTGACPCVYPCYWGRRALDDLQRHGWPSGPRLVEDEAPVA
jgi:hypothetical protein